MNCCVIQLGYAYALMCRWERFSLAELIPP